MKSTFLPLILLLLGNTALANDCPVLINGTFQTFFKERLVTAKLTSNKTNDGMVVTISNQTIFPELNETTFQIDNKVHDFQFTENYIGSCTSEGFVLKLPKYKRLDDVSITFTAADLKVSPTTNVIQMDVRGYFVNSQNIPPLQRIDDSQQCSE